jgi:zinc transport system ATP-binding protein
LNKFQKFFSNHDSSNFCCLKIENLSISFGRTKILEDINIHTHCGELTAIVGPNGAGKTTLFKAIIGEIPFKGTLKYVDANNKSANRPKIGYVPQKLYFDKDIPASVLDLFTASFSKHPVWLFKKEKTKDLCLNLLDRVKGEHLINKKIGSLSGGELQRVLLAISLHPSPNLLLLDEPVSGIDQDGMALFYDIVSNLRETHDLSIIIITHDLPLISKYADNLIFLDKEIKYSGTFEDLRNEKDLDKKIGSFWLKSLLPRIKND